MAKFYLIRHGQTEWNAKRIQQGWLDSPLTTDGIVVAEQVGKKLPADIEIVLTSDLGRAIKTTEIITRDLPKSQVLTDWRLRERSYGDMSGHQINQSEIDLSFQDELASYRGAEPVAHMNERIKSFIRDCALFDVDRFVVVAHSGVLNRFGYLLTDGYKYASHQNSSIIEYDIDFGDPRLLPKELPAWSPVI